MAKIKWRTVIVQGSHQFPYDMLRYDSCFPKGSEDAAAMEPHRKEERRVTLTQVGATPPEADRWKSFNWRLIEYTVSD